MPAYSVTSPVPRSDWRDILEADSEALPSQTPEWLDAMRSCCGFRDCSRLYELGSGRRLLLVMAGKRWLGPFTPQGSWPFDWGIGGVLSSDGRVEPADAAIIFQDLLARPALRTFLRPSPTTGAAFAASAPRTAIRIPHMEQRVPLTGGFATVWKERFRGSVRQAVRRAERSGVEVERDSTGALVPVFYQLYRKSIERWAEQQHEPIALARLRSWRRDPPAKFEAVARSLGERCTIWVARVHGQPAAAIVVLRQGRTAKYWRGAMERDLANPTRANDLLHSLAIEQACADGACWYNMGDARQGSSLARFKSGFGAEEQPYHAYSIERLPFSQIDAGLKRSVKWALRFREA